MFMEIHTVKLRLWRQPKHSERIDCEHDHHGHRKSRQSDASASDALRDQYLRAAAIEKTLQWSAVVGRNRAGSTVFASGK